MKKVKLEDLQVKSFVTKGSILGGRLAQGGLVMERAETGQTECYHCDSLGSNCDTNCTGCDTE